MLATHPESEYAGERTNRFVRYGSSPRGAQAIILAAKIRALVQGRFNVAFEDLEKYMLEKGEAAPNVSGRQEMLENIVNRYV